MAQALSASGTRETVVGRNVRRAACPADESNLTE
jgi:hypothetical protein